MYPLCGTRFDRDQCSPLSLSRLFEVRLHDTVGSEPTFNIRLNSTLTLEAKGYEQESRGFRTRRGLVCSNRAATRVGDLQAREKRH